MSFRQNIILIGLKGSGKTTVAQAFAKQYPEYLYIDTDDLIKKAYKNIDKADFNISNIYQSLGEGEFRAFEMQVIKKFYLSELSKDQKYIIATGGGAVLKLDNIEIFKKIGCLIYLACDPSLIYKRWRINNIKPSFIATESTDKLSDAQFIEYTNNRVEIYKKIADKVINIDSLDVLEIVENVWQVMVLETYLG